MHTVKRNIDIIITLLVIILLVHPIFEHYPLHFEEYSQAILTAKLFVKNNFNFFSFFFYELGPGTTLPLGFNLYLIPTSIFANNDLLYAVLNIFLSFLLQYYFLKRIFFLFNLKNNLILILINITSITFYSLIYFYDYITVLLQLSFFHGIIFYLIKFVNKKKISSIYKCFLILSLTTLIFHLAYNFIFYIFIAFFYIFNFNRINKILNFKTFLIISLIFFLINLENIYYLSDTYFNTSEGTREIRHAYHPKQIFSGLYFIILNLQDIFNLEIINRKVKLDDNYFLPFYGIHIYLAIFVSFYFIKKNLCHKIYYLNYIFFILLFFSIIKINFVISDTPAYFRDIYSIVGVILCGFFLKYFKKKKQLILLTKSIIIFSIIIFYLSNQKVYKSESIAYSLNNQSTEFSSLIKILSNSNKETIDKIYLSPKVYEYFASHKKDKTNFFFKNKIYEIVDFLNYDIYVYNSIFKNSHKNKIKKSKLKMYTELSPKFNEINENFFVLFNIKYLITYKTELQNIDTDFLRLKQEIHNNGKTLLIYEAKKKKFSPVILSYKKDKDICKSSENYIECITSSKNYFSFDKNIKFQRLSNQKYLIKNTGNKDINFIIPFLYDTNWKLKKGKLESLNDHMMYVELKSNSSYELYYNDIIRTILRFISIFSFIFFCLLILKNIKFEKFKRSINK